MRKHSKQAEVFCRLADRVVSATSGRRAAAMLVALAVLLAAAVSWNQRASQASRERQLSELRANFVTHPAGSFRDASRSR